jgi:hypothetical protein
VDELLARGYLAYFREAKRQGWVASQPAEASSGLEQHDGHEYIVLRNVNGTLAVYRVRNDGFLKRLKRWPVALDQY